MNAIQASCVGIWERRLLTLEELLTRNLHQGQVLDQLKTASTKEEGGGRPLVRGGAPGCGEDEQKSVIPKSLSHSTILPTDAAEGQYKWDGKGKRRSDEKN